MAGDGGKGFLGLSGGAALLLALALLAVPFGSASLAQSGGGGGVHEGVASCAGSQCHARQVSSGLVVRQSELVTWQDPGSAAGNHSRAWQVLTGRRSQGIAQRLGIGPAQSAPMCLGCHTDPAPPSRRGARFQISDGVGCEACHGGSGGWLASHRAVGGTHGDNVTRGMIPLDDPKRRAEVCLDCHFGSDRPGQFVDHRMMAAGHPRISFELDLFTTLQRHHDVDADYAARKRVPGGVQTWAVGQSAALIRALTLYADDSKGREGSFPEFYFFDCHSCHRPISDDPNAPLSVVSNPGRPIPSGAPPFNDENMIMLSAAARAVAPDLAARFEADSRAFHVAVATDRQAAVRAAGRLADTTRGLSNAFANRSFSRAETLAMLDDIVGGALAPRFTDYTGSAQAVMAVDTLLNALVASGQVNAGVARAMRTDIDRAYRAVRDPKDYRPAEFRDALQRIGAGVRRLR